MFADARCAVDGKVVRQDSWQVRTRRRTGRKFETVRPRLIRRRSIWGDGQRMLVIPRLITGDPRKEVPDFPQPCPGVSEHHELDIRSVVP